jgi:hypothetical protein
MSDFCAVEGNGCGKGAIASAWEWLQAKRLPSFNKHCTPPPAKSNSFCNVVLSGKNRTLKADFLASVFTPNVQRWLLPQVRTLPSMTTGATWKARPNGVGSAIVITKERPVPGGNHTTLRREFLV